MSKVLRLRCPGCTNTLRVPAEWLNQPMRCKHCNLVIKTRNKTAAAAAVGGGTRPADAAVAVADAPTAPPGFDQMRDETIPVTSRYNRQKKNQGMWLVAGAGVCVLGLGLIVAILITVGNMVSQAGGLSAFANSMTPSAAPAANQPNQPDDLKPGETGEAGVRGEYPRRLLAVTVSNYLYANPVNYGEVDPTDETKGRNIHALMTRLSRALHIPASQVTELSDAGPVRLARPTIKPVIEQTITDFLKVSRPQDRVMMLFAGHAVDIENAVYLVPLEGELTDKSTLIPLAWVYDQLARCRARQKLFIVDVCRFDPGRGVERPGTGPMSEAVDKALANPPDGVQVWSSCVAGQISWEYEAYALERMDTIKGGVFINSLYHSIGPDVRKRANLGLQRPQDPYPLDLLSEAVSRVTAATVDDIQKVKQTPRLVGQELPGGAAYDPDAPLPPKVEPKTPKPSDGSDPVGLAALRTVLDETENKLPTKRFGDEASHLRAEALPPFSSKVMAPYLDKEANDGISPYRQAVNLAVKNLIASQQKKDDFMDQLFNNNPELKKAILKNQREPARIRLDLQDAMDALDAVKDKRKEEKSKRWVATYDYVYARVAARMAYIDEYNLMLGKVRKDELPQLGPKDNGWRIASREKPNTREAKELAGIAKKSLDRMIKENPGTPWEVLGKREKLTGLGLEWQATAIQQ